MRSPGETCCHLLPIKFWPQVPAETRAALPQPGKLERRSERSIAVPTAAERVGSGAWDKTCVSPSHPTDVPPSPAPQHTEPRGAGRGSPTNWGYFGNRICPQASPALAARRQLEGSARRAQGGEEDGGCRMLGSCRLLLSECLAPNNIPCDPPGPDTHTTACVTGARCSTRLIFREQQQPPCTGVTPMSETAPRRGYPQRSQPRGFPSSSPTGPGFVGTT